jgi:hypothetical protein
MIVAKGKFIQIQGQIVFRDLVIGANNATLQQRPEAFDVVGRPPFLGARILAALAF